MQSHETESLEQWPRQLTEIKQIDCSHSLVADVRLKKIMLSARWKWCTFLCSSQHIYCYYYYFYLTVSTVFFCCVACHHLADDHRMCNRSIFCILYCVMHWLQCVRLLCVCMCGWLTQNTMMQVNTFEHASRCTAVMHKHECLSTINPWHPIGLHYGVWTRVRQGDYNRRGRLMSHRWNWNFLMNMHFDCISSKHAGIAWVNNKPNMHTHTHTHSLTTHTHTCSYNTNNEFNMVVCSHTQPLLSLASPTPSMSNDIHKKKSNRYASVLSVVVVL